MKSSNSKFSVLFIVLCNILIVATIVISYVLTINYDYPDIITRTDFIVEMEDIGCSLIDMKEQETYSGVDLYLVSDEDTCPYLLSYTVFDNSENLNEFYSQIYYDIMNNNTNVTGKTSVNINSKYYEYSTIGDYYKIGILNGNSVLYATVDKEYREDIINLFNEFDYKYDIELMNGSIFTMLSVAIVFFVFFVSMYKIEKKIRNNGNVGLIPFYNIWCLSNDVLGSPWYSLLLVVPVGNAIFIFMFCRNMAKVFNKSGSYSIGLMLLPTVFLPLLAFDDSVYTKSVKNKVIEETKDFKLNGKGILRIIFDIINWIITILFVPLGLIFLLVFFNSKFIEDMFFGLFFIVLGLMICPLITKHTKKYKIYTMCKWLIITLFVILLFII